jgi:hypothetical protein
MQAGDPGTMGSAVLGILQAGALVALALSVALAIWRAVSDYAQGDNQVGVKARH